MSNSAEKVMNVRIAISSVIVLLMVMNSPVAMGQGGESITSAEINGDSLSQANGVLGVNQAAGDSNAQSNSRAIAISENGGVAIAYTFDAQNVIDNQATMPDVSVSRIGDNALNGASGLISINQASGAQNVQLNAFAMAMSIAGDITDVSLAETHTGDSAVLPVDTGAVTTQRAAHVDSAAFVGAGGIVQLNQASGLGNVSSNHFEMSMGPAN